MRVVSLPSPNKRQWRHMQRFYLIWNKKKTLIHAAQGGVRPLAGQTGNPVVQMMPNTHQWQGRGGLHSCSPSRVQPWKGCHPCLGLLWRSFYRNGAKYLQKTAFISLSELLLVHPCCLFWLIYSVITTKSGLLTVTTRIKLMVQQKQVEKQCLFFIILLKTSLCCKVFSKVFEQDAHVMVWVSSIFLGKCIETPQLTSLL